MPIAEQVPDSDTTFLRGGEGELAVVFTPDHEAGLQAGPSLQGNCVVDRSNGPAGTADAAAPVAASVPPSAPSRSEQRTETVNYLALAVSILLSNLWFVLSVMQYT